MKKTLECVPVYFFVMDCSNIDGAIRTIEDFISNCNILLWRHAIYLQHSLYFKVIHRRKNKKSCHEMAFRRIFFMGFISVFALCPKVGI